MKPSRVRLSCTATAQIGEAIEVLLWGGLHGNNRSEVVQRLISDAICRLAHEGYIDIRELQEPKVRPKS